MSIFFVPALLFMAASVTPARAADAILCPQKIEVTERLTGTVAGWSISSDAAPHQLAGLTFFDGKPEEKASLAPDSEVRVKGKVHSTWTFPAGGGPIWVACSYAGTNLTLSRVLPKSARSCLITYSGRDTVAGLPVIEKVDCK
jgi:hypothetical protein